MKLYTSLKDGGKDEYGQLINPQYLDEVFKIEFINHSKLVHKVRIVQSKDEPLHLREVNVFAFNRKIKSYSGSVSQSTTVNNNFAGKAVDGDLGTMSQTDKFTKIPYGGPGSAVGTLPGGPVLDFGYYTSKYYISAYNFPKYHA
jgi:hypothetical protein